MGSPAIFSGRRSKLLTAEGLLMQSGATIDNDGPINFIPSGNAEANVNPATMYADGTAVPVDGAGGSPTATFTITTTTPLRGLRSFVFTPGALGDGAAIPFLVDRAALGKVQEIKLDYEITTYASFTDGDLTAYIIAPSGAVIQPVGFQIVKASGPQQFKAIFQTEITGTSYKLLIHQATATTSYGSVKIDSISVGPQSTVNATLITDWQSWTPTGSWTTNTTYTGRWRRVGDTGEYEVYIGLSGAPNATSLTINLPSGQTFDTAKMTSTGAGNALGSIQANSGGAQYDGVARYNNTSSVIGIVLGAAATYVNEPAAIDASVPFTWANGNYLTARWKAPILGWGSNTLASSDAGDGRVVAAHIYGTPTGTIASTYSASSSIIFPSVSFDHTNSYSTITGAYTPTTPGTYRLSGVVSINAAYTTTAYAYIAPYVNGVSTNARAANFAPANGTYKLPVAFSFDVVANAGQPITLRAACNGTGPSFATGIDDYSLSIERISGSSSIVAGETVAVRATSTSGASLTANTPTDFAFNNTVFSTHGSSCWNGTTFTAPMAGKFLFAVKSSLSSMTWGTGQGFQIQLIKNSTAFAYNVLWGNGAAVNPNILLVAQIDLLAGETVKAQVTSPQNTTLNTSAMTNYIDIVRVGN